GIAPLMAMLRHRALNASRVPARLLYSSRNQAEIIYRDELARLAGGDDSLQITQTLTRERPAGWTGPTRRIDRPMLAQVGYAAEARPQVYICGPNGLVESAAQHLIDLGHDPLQIRTERFGPTT